MGSRLHGRRVAIGVLDPPLRASIRASLEREAAEVSAHGSLDDLLAALDPARPIDLCIVDVDLPGLAADADLRRLRSLSARIPVVRLTGHLQPDPPGPVDDPPTLTLPFGRAQLIGLVERLLRSR